MTSCFGCQGRHSKAISFLPAKMRAALARGTREPPELRRSSADQNSLLLQPSPPGFRRMDSRNRPATTSSQQLREPLELFLRHFVARIATAGWEVVSDPTAHSDRKPREVGESYGDRRTRILTRSQLDCRPRKERYRSNSDVNSLTFFQGDVILGTKSRRSSSRVQSCSGLNRSGSVTRE